MLIYIASFCTWMHQMIATHRWNMWNFTIFYSYNSWCLLCLVNINSTLVVQYIVIIPTATNHTAIVKHFQKLYCIVSNGNTNADLQRIWEEAVIELRLASVQNKIWTKNLLITIPEHYFRSSLYGLNSHSKCLA